MGLASQVMEEFFGLIDQLPNATDGTNGKEPGDDESISSLAKIAHRGKPTSRSLAVSNCHRVVVLPPKNREKRGGYRKREETQRRYPCQPNACVWGTGPVRVWCLRQTFLASGTWLVVEVVTFMLRLGVGVASDARGSVTRLGT